MKKNLLLFIATIFYFFSFSQEPADALRYSYNVPGATARIKAVGGAMGSLGGDITATFVNPAGLAFYKTGDVIITPAYNFGKTKATYLGRTESEKNNNLMVGTSGVVFGVSNRGNLRNVSFSFAMNRAADFNSNILYKGQNNQSSFSQKFAEELNNSGVKNAQQAEFDFPLGASLVYNTHWIDSVRNASGGIDRFVTNAPIATGLIQQHTSESTGGINEFSFGLAANMRDKIMIGGAIGIPVLNYNRNTEFLEADATTNPNNAFNYGIFSDELNTKGVGVNLKAGLIYKPVEHVRLGFALHSPTVYSLTDNYAAEVTLNDDVADNMSWRDKTINYTNGEPSEFKYQLVTPYKVIGSFSYVLREIEDVRKQKGFLTADVEYINYAAASFQAEEENGNDQTTINYLKSLTSAIDKAYRGAFNFRVGGELKFTTVMVRAGAAYYGNPYQNIRGENGNKLDLSGGLGYRHRGFFIDLTYVHSLQKDVHFAYRLQSAPYFGANMKTTKGNALLTLGFKI